MPSWSWSMHPKKPTPNALLLLLLLFLMITFGTGRGEGGTLRSQAISQRQTFPDSEIGCTGLIWMHEQLTQVALLITTQGLRSNDPDCSCPLKGQGSQMCPGSANEIDVEREAAGSLLLQARTPSSDPRFSALFPLWVCSPMQ